MGLITVLKNVNLENGRKLEREPTIDSGTRAFYDFRSKWAGAGKDLGGGALIKDLTHSTVDDATIQTPATYTYVGNGLRQTQGRITLPVEAVPKYGDEEWLLQFWVNPEQYGNPGNANNQILNISNFSTWNYNLAMCSIILTVDADGKTPSIIHFGVRGKVVQLTDPTSIAKFKGAASREPVLVSVHYKYGATTDLIEIYLDNELAGSLNTAPWTTPILEPSIRCLSASTGYIAFMTGKYYRYRLDDLALTNRTASELISLEYEQCKDIFQ